jgi:hypothetical protein
VPFKVQLNSKQIQRMVTIERVDGIGNPSKYFTPPLPSSLGIR